MPAPLPRRTLPAALVLALVVHVAMAAFVAKAWHDARHASSIVRQKGALQLTLRRDAPPPAKPTAPAPERNGAAPSPRKQAPRPERRTS